MKLGNYSHSRSFDWQYRQKPDLSFRFYRESVRISCRRILGQLCIGNDSTQFRRCSATHRFQKNNRCKDEARNEKEQAIFDTLRIYIKECKPIRFDGNGYSDEWKEEAKQRGLDCETSVPLIYDAYTSEQSVHMFESIMSCPKKNFMLATKWNGKPILRNPDWGACSWRPVDQSYHSCCHSISIGIARQSL